MKRELKKLYHTVAENPRYRGVRIVTAWVFLVLGGLGLFLPFLQGILFLLIGLTLLSKDNPRLQRYRCALVSRLRRPNRHDNGQDDKDELLAADCEEGHGHVHSHETTG
ncbi:hypothetical protein JW905_15715 [bacterium]|nr:hypothetical protein [candidate division CSSED10-310 bacterium]